MKFIEQTKDVAMRIQATILFFFVGQLLIGQSINQNVILEWQHPDYLGEKTVINFEGGVFNQDLLPTWNLKLENQKITSLKIKNTTYSPIPTDWKNYIDITKIPSDFEFSTYEKFTTANYSISTMIPIRKQNDEIQILNSFTIEYETEKVTAVPFQPKTFVNSVLSNGNWLKVGITSEGMYKLTYEQLQSNGLISSSVNSNLLQVYGNGGGMLPEINSAFRYNDLYENAIEVVDGGDGNFGAGDYILFFAQGPHVWKYNTSTKLYKQEYNVYADTNFYFVTVGSTAGKRITTRASLTGTPTYATTTADGYVYKEDDKYNLNQTGRTWLGDLYNFSNTYTYNFNLEDYVTSDTITLGVLMAARCVACNTNIRLEQNSNLITNFSIGAASPVYTAPYATWGSSTNKFTSTTNNISLRITRTSGDQAWLDYVLFNYRKNISANSSFKIFSDKKAIGETNAKFSCSGANSSHQVWDITNPLEPILQNYALVSSNAEFQVNMDTLRRFVIFEPSNSASPVSITNQPNQNLHGLADPSRGTNFVIITHPSLLNSANQLANFHATNDGMQVDVVTVNNIYNEFSSGKQDISAIKYFLKEYFDNNPTNYPKYVLFWGDGSYDYKYYLDRGDYPNTNFVPSYQTTESFDRAGQSYSSDDFFALLENDEGSNGFVALNGGSNIDVGIGRIPIVSDEEGMGVLNKIITYATGVPAMRDWRNTVTVVADDAEAAWENSFITNSESITNQINTNWPVWNVDKVYLDSYVQVTNAGQRYPDANVALDNRMNNGSIMINYIGHGGETGWTSERVLNIDNFDNLENIESLPAFCTATCTFTRFDNPNFQSAGEDLMVASGRGAIALISTIRPISIVPNFNAKVYNATFNLLAGERPRLGDIIRIAKQPIPLNDYGEQNILLFGDPALRLAYPDIKVVTDSINGLVADESGAVTDTLMASQIVTIVGHITDNSDVLMSSFNGDLYTTIFDKESILSTLANDPGANVYNFRLLKNVIFKGKSTITNGRFKFQFVVPLDINYNIGTGKISYYATDNISTDAHGYYKNVSIGSSDVLCSSDTQGPQVEIFMNDTNFLDMGITNSSPIIYVKAIDSSGINTTGIGIGHDLQAIIDGDIQNPINLNNYYVADNNSYASGVAKYQLTGLEPGIHLIEVQVWDGCNNFTKADLNFVVTNTDATVINMTAFPNPFSDVITFAFEHNFEGKNVDAQIIINDMNGSVVYEYSKSYVPDNHRDLSFNWNGRSNGGNEMNSGVYVCRILLKDQEGNQVSACCKIVLIR